MVSKFSNKYKIGIDTIENSPIEVTEDGVILRYVKNGSEIGIERILKGVVQEASGERIFFDIECLTGKNECIITDSYIEKLSFNEIGFDNVISTPYSDINDYGYIGACLDSGNDYFKHIDTIYLAISNSTIENELARRLGKVRCKVLNYGTTASANAILKQHENPKDVIVNIIENSNFYPIDGIFLANDFEERIIAIYENGLPDGANSQYPHFNDLVTFYPGMLCMMYGYPSAGKTTMLNQLLWDFYSLNGWKTGIYSPEYWSKELHYMTMAETIINKPAFKKKYDKIGMMSSDELRSAIRCMNDWFFKIEPGGKRTIDDALEKEIELVKRYGINCFVIDPWKTIVHRASSNMNLTDHISELLYKIKNTGAEYGVCNIIVAHPTKPTTKTGEVPPPAQAREISGSSSFGDLADVCISIYRNRLSENETDLTSLIVQKNRLEGITGQVGCASFEWNPYQYKMTKSNRTINFQGIIQNGQCEF